MGEVELVAVLAAVPAVGAGAVVTTRGMNRKRRELRRAESLRSIAELESALLFPDTAAEGDTAELDEYGRPIFRLFAGDWTTAALLKPGGWMARWTGRPTEDDR